jgi:hypothetical protein
MAWGLLQQQRQQQQQAGACRAIGTRDGTQGKGPLHPPQQSSYPKTWLEPGMAYTHM